MPNLQCLSTQTVEKVFSVTSQLEARLKLTSSSMGQLRTSSLSTNLCLASPTSHPSGPSAGNKPLGNILIKIQ